MLMRPANRWMCASSLSLMHNRIGPHQLVGRWLFMLSWMCLSDRAWRWVRCFCFLLRSCVRTVVCYGLFRKFKVFMHWRVFSSSLHPFFCRLTVYVFCYNLIWSFYLIGVYMVFAIIRSMFLIIKSVRKNELEY